MNNTIHILVSFDENYIPPFKTMLTSLVLNNRNEHFNIWLLHSAVSSKSISDLDEYCSKLGCLFNAITVENTIFKNAPISKRYPQEMYYRLLASHLLPKDINRILYLDPDILIINSILPLWNIDLKENLFAAASHSGITNFMNEVNRVRLNTKHDYFNSGVLLMDLDKGRKHIKKEDIFQCVEDHKNELFLPDQDVFNYLYGSKTLPLDDTIYNYDARYYSAYFIRSNNECNMDWLMKNTVILHFCGKSKPWRKSSYSRFSSLYKHYMNLSSK